MNKKTIITILLALVTMTGQAQTKNYTIRGNLSEGLEYRIAKEFFKSGQNNPQSAYCYFTLK